MGFEPMEPSDRSFRLATECDKPLCQPSPMSVEKPTHFERTYLLKSNQSSD